jgi:hypothetical protein
MITNADFVWFVDQALDAMVGIVGDLGEPLANERPGLPGANSPYAILNHCLGVMTWWGEYVVGGHQVKRDREAEFTIEGPISALITRVPGVRNAFVDRVNSANFGAPLHGAIVPEDEALPFGRTQGAALFHVYEELAQHLGQLELTRDILIDRRRRR